MTLGKPIEFNHPLESGETINSPGGTFKYRVIGACCRLYDRNSLPYPCCRLSWAGKEPFWNRVGKRFVPDMGAKNSPAYCVQLVDYPDSQPFVITLYWLKLTLQQQRWWYSKVKGMTLVEPEATSVLEVA